MRRMERYKLLTVHVDDALALLGGFLLEDADECVQLPSRGNHCPGALERARCASGEIPIRGIQERLAGVGDDQRIYAVEVQRHPLGASVIHENGEDVYQV